MVIIFNLSGQTGRQSAALSGTVTKGIVKLLFGKDTSLTNEEITAIISTFHVFVRKAAHFTAYFLIGVFSSIAMSTYNCKQKHKTIVPLSIGLIYAIADELHQAFVPERGPKVLDVGLDFIGCLCGVSIVLLMDYYLKRRKKNEEKGID